MLAKRDVQTQNNRRSFI